MENKVMNSEQVKVEKFFNKLLDKSVSKVVSWFLIGIFIFLTMIMCMMPAQEIFIGTEDAPMLMPGVLAMLSYLMVYFRVLPYKHYTENQKSRFMTEILQYHPISKKALWKIKTLKLLQFLGKVAAVGLVLQIVVSFISYKTVSWLNFFYIIFFMFFLPIVGEFIFDGIAGAFTEE